MALDNDSDTTIRNYARQITLTLEEERQRIARDLHDDISSRLLLLIRKLELLASSEQSDTSCLKENLAALRDEAVDTLDALRRTAQGLRPRIIDDLGLVAAIEWLAGETEKDEGIPVTVTVTGMECEPSGETGIVLFRIVQEALTNIRRHAEARHIGIEITGSREAISVGISDDGRGFQTAEIINHPGRSDHLGIIGMRERAQLLDGTFTIDSEPGQGTRISVSLPRDM